MTKPTIGFAGMTHLGLNSAAAAAERGFPTLCFDPDKAVIERLTRGTLPVMEPDLPGMLARNAGHISYSADIAALAGCDVVYIASDVPTDDQGRSELSGIRALIDTVSTGMSPEGILVVLCQVPPGFTRGLKRDKTRLYYQVETLIFGRAVERAMYPERYIIGCADPAQPLPPAFAEFLGAYGCPILPMRYESAELAKISINMCLVASVTVANTMAELCEATGADWSEIVPALKLDKRIGQFSYLKPGLGIAGGNLERDLATVLRMADTHGTDAGVVAAWVANSRHRKEWAWRTLEGRVLPTRPDARIGVLGLAYKEDTHSTKNSPSLALLAHLGGCAVKVYDPVVPASDAGIPVTGCASALEAAADADVVVIMTPWAEFKAIDPKALAATMAGRVVLDPLRVLDPRAAAEAGLDYVTMGVSPTNS